MSNKMVIKSHPRNYASRWSCMVEVVRETPTQWIVKRSCGREVRFNKVTRKSIGEKFCTDTIHTVLEYAEDTLHLVK